MIQVIDASVAAKWFFSEPGEHEARAIAESGRALIAPDLVVAEVCNVAWRKVIARQISAERAQAIGLHLPALFNRLIPCADLAPRAIELAISLRHPVYDCFYLALTEAAHGELVTADEKLVRIARNGGFDPLRLRLIRAPD